MPAIPFGNESIAIYYKTNLLFSGSVTATHAIAYSDNRGIKLVYENLSTSANSVLLTGTRSGATVTEQIDADALATEETSNWFNTLISTNIVNMRTALL